MAEITVKELLEAGAHFGHQTSRWNPKMRRFILAAKNGIHLINLKETITCVDAAAKKLSEVVETGGVTVYVDPKATLYLLGSEMDYVEDRLKSGFVFRNPNEKARCGCGESFHV